MSGAPLLAVDRLSYGYPGRLVGHEVSLAVERGEVLCVLGRNGEGKSTLFKTVLGLLPPLAGMVRVEGEPTAGWHPRRRATTFGWVGLVVPHLARLTVGPAFTRLLPVSVLFGAGYLLAVDTVARTLGAVELPLGVLTAALGTPVFLWLLGFGRRTAWS